MCPSGGSTPALCEVAAQELAEEHNTGREHGAGKRATVDEIGEDHYRPPFERPIHLATRHVTVARQRLPPSYVEGCFGYSLMPSDQQSPCQDRDGQIG